MLNQSTSTCTHLLDRLAQEDWNGAEPLIHELQKEIDEENYPNISIMSKPEHNRILSEALLCFAKTRLVSQYTGTGE
jgi:hypothetical protein